MWHNGSTNENAMYEAWIVAKLKEYEQNKLQFIFGKAEIITIDDEEILKDHFNIKDSDDWILEVVENIIDKMKSDSISERLHYFKILCNLISNDDEGRIKDIIVGKYDLDEIYKKVDIIPTMGEHQINTLLKLVQKKLTRSEENKERDDTMDLFVFIGSEKFSKKENGDYKKSLGIENLVKIDLYDPVELQQINMMKMRAHADKSDVYMIWIPKDTFEEEKDSYFPEEIPEFILDAIDKKKTRI